MKLASPFVRKAVLSALVGNVDIGSGPVPVYGRVPNNASYPYIAVKTIDNSETDANNQSYISETTVILDVVSRFKSDEGGMKESNLYANAALQILRTRSNGYLDMESDGFKVTKIVMTNTSELEEDFKDNYYYRTIITLSVKTQQI